MLSVKEWSVELTSWPGRTPFSNSALVAMVESVVDGCVALSAVVEGSDVVEGGDVVEG